MGEDKKDDVKKEKTVKEIIDTMNDEQKEAMYAVVGQALENQANGEGDEANKENGGEETMKHNVFDNDNKDEVLQHSEIIAEAMADGKKYGSLRESFIQHAAINNIENLDKLFPDATELYKEPYMIEKDNSWVAKVMNAVKHTPFSRVKTTFGRMNE